MYQLYDGIVNSPETELTQNIDATQTTIPVKDTSKLPAPPNLAVIGRNEDAETILYTGKSGNTLTGVTRGFQGQAKSWKAGAPVARRFTEYDWRAITTNFIKHSTQPIYNVRGFGAKGDGVTDDTAAIQAAIYEATQAGGGCVYLPRGVYVVTSPIVLPSTTPISIVGSGEDQTTIKAGAPLTTVIHKPVGYVSHQKLQDFTVDGDLKADCCLFVEEANQFFISLVHFKRSLQSVVRLVPAQGKAVYEVYMTDCKITGVEPSDPADPRPNYGIEVTGTDNYFNNIVIRNTKSAGVYDNGANNTYTNVHVFGWPQETHSPTYGIDLNNGRAVVAQCYMDGIPGAGIRISQGYTTVVGSLFFWRYDVPVPPGASGVVIESDATRYNIIGNTFRGYAAYAVKINGTVSGTIVANNSIDVTNPPPQVVYNSGSSALTLFDSFVVQQLNLSTVETSINLDVASSKYATLAFKVNGLRRWVIQKDNSTESGNNAGSDLVVAAYNDDGSYLGQTLKLLRNSGVVAAVRGDFQCYTPGKGLVVRTPDGTKHYRITVDNNGNLITQQV